MSLPETSEETAVDVAARMTAAGRPMIAHTLAFNRIAKAKSTSVLVSTELGSYSQDSSRGSTSVVPTLVMTSDDGSGPTIIAAHPVAPITGYLDAWHADLRWLATACTGENIIMAGDLNSTIDHYGPLANTTADSIGDCRDAALHTGDAAAGTWPANPPCRARRPHRPRDGDGGMDGDLGERHRGPRRLRERPSSDRRHPRSGWMITRRCENGRMTDSTETTPRATTNRSTTPASDLFRDYIGSGWADRDEAIPEPREQVALRRATTRGDLQAAPRQHAGDPGRNAEGALQRHRLPVSARTPRSPTSPAGAATPCPGACW